MAKTTTAQSSSTIEIPLRTGELAISCSSEMAGRFAVAMGARVADLLDFGDSILGGLPVTEGVMAGATLAVGGRIRNGIGPHAVSAGTSSNVASVTSQTRWRAPADALCIDRVMPSATTRIRVAFTSSISIETLEPLIAKLEKEIIAVISRSDERVECWCEGA